MYRGHGYEKFPVVLGTVEGHQELCDKWDTEQISKLTRKAAKLRQALRTAYVVHDTDSESTDESNGEEDGTNDILQKKCLESVLDVFPDIGRAFVMWKIQLLSSQLGYYVADGEIFELEATRIAGHIIAEVLEMNPYPKERVATFLDSGSRAADDGTGVTIMWNRNLPKGDMYTKDAVIILAKTFDRVPTHYIAKVVSEKKSIFDAYTHIQDLEDRFYSISNRPYSRLRHARSAIEKKYELTHNDRRIPSEYANRINELQAAKQHVAREAIQAAAQKEKAREEEANLALHKESGAVMECQCCFDDQVPLNRLVSCMADQPHFFCFTCVEGLADNQVGLMRHEMRCMDGSGCTFELSHDGVGQAVPIRTFDRLQLTKQQAEIIAAGIEGLEECQFCDYKAVCDDVSVEPVFYCQNPGCSRATCRKCNKDSHLPKTCEENQNDGELSVRHVVEEARSEAVMRTCPKCKVKIVKEFGCNKMVCTNCHTMLCYECKADISATENPYHHYNKPGAKCLLYDRQGIDRHEVEANRAEIEAIDQAKEKHADIDDSKLRIETGKQVQPASHEHPAAGAFFQHMNNAAGHLTNRQIDRNEILRDLIPDPHLGDVLRQIHQGDGAQEQAEDYHRRGEAQIEARLLHMEERLNGLHRDGARYVAQYLGLPRPHGTPLLNPRQGFLPDDALQPARVGVMFNQNLQFEDDLDHVRPAYPLPHYPPQMDRDIPRMYNGDSAGRGLQQAENPNLYPRTPMENLAEAFRQKNNVLQRHDAPHNNSWLPRMPPGLPQNWRFGTRWYRGDLYRATRL
ncbi:hypothetical protein A1O3_05369 [Capronia epimyces CBS 606.96]|uniref:RING-type domain-containing protein n=1 Tax=Capronia epimyces CBS 606.96 TaxID=1182542 RepID=W9YR04_9EURO|nr:uncharacterized protein A1O3_05369 [Capronia epimyces CBS 606.96]EXJ84699.1 hypothetical protein A1O3_05369 [Capronia epimyces CBS 606.96]